MNDLIKKWEGFRPQAYKCQAGVWTCGFGTTIYPNGQRVKAGDTCTMAQAEQWLACYLETEINHYLDRDFPSLKPNQREALQSLLYNWGYPSFRRSKLFKAIKDNNIEQIFRQWDIITANGKPSLGLIRRRLDELQLFFS